MMSEWGVLSGWFFVGGFGGDVDFYFIVDVWGICVDVEIVVF